MCRYLIWPGRGRSWSNTSSTCARLLKTLPSDPGNDKLMPKYRLISQVARYTDSGTVVGLMAMLERFGEPGKTTVVQKNWPGGKAQALAELARWDEFAAESPQPLVQTWREHRYEPILRAIMPARAAVRPTAARGRRPELPGPVDESGRSACATIRRSGSTSASGSPICWWTSFRIPIPIQAEVMLLLTAQTRDGDRLAEVPAGRWIAVRRRRPEAVDLPFPPGGHRHLQPGPPRSSNEAGADRCPFGQFPHHRSTSGVGQQDV